MQIEKASQYNKMYRDAFVCCENILCRLQTVVYRGMGNCAVWEERAQIIPTRS